MRLQRADAFVAALKHYQKHGRIVLYDGDVEGICQTLKRYREALRRIQELEAEKRKAP